MSRNGKHRKSGIVSDRHLLYTAAVQSVDADIDFFKRVYKKRHGKKFKRLREDFCGTAALACEWVQRKDDHHAWGVDLDLATLDWGRAHYVTALKNGARERLHLLNENVLQVGEPKVDLVAALNFSYNVFKDRESLREYFSAVRRSLADGGVFVIDVVGGQESFGELEEDRKIPKGKAWNGAPVPGFTYIWEQAKFNPIDHHAICKIHFKLKDGTKLKNAFVYDWRLWTLPELRELLVEAGFVDPDVYVEGWDDETDESDGIFRRRRRFENQSGWVAYIVAHTAAD